MTGPERDPGLQAERTLLAWSRTALVLAVNATLVLRTGLADRRPELTVLGALLAAASCAMYGFGLRRRARLEHHPATEKAAEPLPVGVGALRAVAATVALVAVAAAWCVLVSGPAVR